MALEAKAGWCAVCASRKVFEIACLPSLFRTNFCKKRPTLTSAGLLDQRGPRAKATKKTMNSNASVTMTSSSPTQKKKMFFPGSHPRLGPGKNGLTARRAYRFWKPPACDPCQVPWREVARAGAERLDDRPGREIQPKRPDPGPGSYEKLLLIVGNDFLVILVL